MAISFVTRMLQAGMAGGQAGKRLSEQDLGPLEAQCPLCHSEQPRGSVITLQEVPAVELLECANCAAISASRMPTEKALIDYYCDYYSHFASGFTFDGDVRFAQRLIGTGKIPVTKRSAVSVLDFGGGVEAGLARAVAQILLEERRTEKVKLTLVDYNARGQKASAQTEVVAYRTLYELPHHQTFDVIIASAIMEHVPDLGRDLLILLNSLALGGVAYFRTPSNSKMIRFLKNFGITLDFTYPAHLHDLGEPFWARVLPALHLTDSHRLIHSKPAIVETDFLRTPVRSAAAWTMKAPWYILGSKWAMVGGWEAIIQRLS